MVVYTLSSSFCMSATFAGLCESLLETGLGGLRRGCDELVGGPDTDEDVFVPDSDSTETTDPLNPEGTGNIGL